MKKSQIKLWAILAAWLAARACVFAGESKTVTQYDVTWTFDKPVQTGQFVTGDWWVVPPPGQDSVTVVSVTPAPEKTSDDKLFNGSMINPKPETTDRGLLTGFQAFDQRGPLWKSERGATYPLKLKVNQSLGSAVCYTEATTDQRSLKTTFPKLLKYVAVLTCLSKPALPTDFRPAFAGDDKTVYSSVNLRRNLLPDLALPAPLQVPDPKTEEADRKDPKKAGNLIPNLKNLAATHFSRPWMDWYINFGGLHCEYEANYGREKTSDVGQAGLLLCLDKKVVGDKEPLLIGMVQTGIDLYGILCAGGKWTSDGGWNMGRKFPILFAGLMLNDQGMLGIGKKYAPESRTFQEDDQAFIVTQADVDRKLDIMINGPVKTASKDTFSFMVKSKRGGVSCVGNYVKITEGPGAGQERFVMKCEGDANATKPGVADSVVLTCTVRPAWDVVPVADKSVIQVLGYRKEDIGKPTWGIQHVIHPEWDNPSWCSPGYNKMNKAAWTGQLLAARILGLKEAWNYDAPFLLVDEYIAHTAPDGSFIGERAVVKTGWFDPRFGFAGGFFGPMWEAYRSKYGDPSPKSAK